MSPGNFIVMLVGAVEEGNSPDSSFDGFSWTVHRVPDCMQFLGQLFRVRPEVVVCEAVLPDGSWKDILGVVETLYNPPPVIVTSMLGSDELWAEVLTRGGYDALKKPLDPEELRRVVDMAGHRYRMLQRKAQTPGSDSGPMAP
jgi:DNA-binding response OmpR family regulator